MFKIPVKKISLIDDDLDDIVKKYVFPSKRVNKQEFKRIFTSESFIARFLNIIEVENFKVNDKYYLNERTYKMMKNEYLNFKQELLFIEDVKKIQLNISKQKLY